MRQKNKRIKRQNDCYEEICSFVLMSNLLSTNLPDIFRPTEN